MITVTIKITEVQQAEGLRLGLRMESDGSETATEMEASFALLLRKVVADMLRGMMESIEEEESTNDGSGAVH